MPLDPKDVVATGYNEVAQDYLERYSSSAVREVWLDELVRALSTGKPAYVLDLGCGAGVPVSKRLADLGHRVLGVDGSVRQVELARTNVPHADFLHADMTALDLASASFDGICAFYSIIHVPAAEQGRLLCRVPNWLKPGGAFVATFGAGPAGDWQGNWLGADMFFSQHDVTTSLSLVRQAGLHVSRAETVAQDDEEARFLWIVAHKPR
jgi:SAM-dependent methyltransferase